MGQGAGHAEVVEISVEEQLIPLGGEVTVASFARKLAAADRKSVVVVCGAGISVSAGIPDFRTPGSGLYDNLQKYNLPTPESIFTLEYFKENPLPFFQLAKEIYPGTYSPTPTHAFIRLLQDKGLLRRCFTQNIDTLERVAGVNPALLVEAHGSFGQAHCLECKAQCSSDWVREEIFADRVPVRCPKCGGLVKPDIVFFGEALPKRFAMLFKAELPEAALLIVMGSSLQVEPFASTINQVGPLCPRLLINREIVGKRQRTSEGFRFDAYDNYRDVALITDCDAAVRAIAEANDWLADLEALVETQALIGHAAKVDESKQADPLHASTADLTSAMQRSWRPRFEPGLPTLRPLTEQAVAENGFQILTLPESGSVEEVEGGSSLEIRVLHGNSNGSEHAYTSVLLGFVPSGSTLPQMGSEWVPVQFQDLAGGVSSASASLMVPPLRKAQLEDGEIVSFELWLVAERRMELSEQKEGLALARAGPLRVAKNSEGVAVANSFTRMAIRSVVAGHQSRKDVDQDAEAHKPQESES